MCPISIWGSHAYYKMEKQHIEIIAALEQLLIAHPDRAVIVRRAESMLKKDGIVDLQNIISSVTEETNKRGPWRGTLG